MSFASDIKNELAHLTTEKKCCKLAEIAGFIRAAGSVKLMGGGKITFHVSTENPAIARRFKKTMKDYFGANSNVLVGQANFRKVGHSYELNMTDSSGAELILRETGILSVKEGCNHIENGIYDGILKTKCCRKSYLRGVFLGAGTVNDPEKGYHMEVVCRTNELAADLKRLFNSFLDIHTKTVSRKNHFVVYLKESEQILDVLNIMGAHTQLLKFENVRIIKELRNKANRIINCDSANVDKAIRAAEGQLSDIAKIQKSIGLESLPENLYEVAVLRLENPDVSMSELGELLNPPVAKSGINYRFARIKEIATKAL
jgi:DNA-binding protein WhiA